jgi:hypothetical protein
VRVDIAAFHHEEHEGHEEDPLFVAFVLFVV